MANYSSSFADALSRNSFLYRVIIVQILVGLFLCINFLLILTFFMKDCFYTTMRYILFATTLLSDTLMLFLSNVLHIFNYLQVTTQLWLCLIICTLLILYSFVTPLTLTAMTLERYVAICMPLHHGELCTTRSTMHCILIIHGLSSVNSIVVLLIFFASSSLSLYDQHRICRAEIFIFQTWHIYLNSAISQFYFLIMCVIIVFSYVKIMRVAKAASGENRKSTWKGLRTVILHAFQLLLYLIQLWCPFIESAILKTDLALYIHVRYFNYITFYLVPRCLNPLIYGLRDEKFFHTLKHSVLCGLFKKKNFSLH